MMMFSARQRNNVCLLPRWAYGRKRWSAWYWLSTKHNLWQGSMGCSHNGWTFWSVKANKRQKCLFSIEQVASLWSLAHVEGESTKGLGNVSSSAGSGMHPSFGEPSESEIHWKHSLLRSFKCTKGDPLLHNCIGSTGDFENHRKQDSWNSNGACTMAISCFKWWNYRDSADG